MAGTSNVSARTATVAVPESSLVKTNSEERRGRKPHPTSARIETGMEAASLMHDAEQQAQALQAAFDNLIAAFAKVSRLLPAPRVAIKQACEIMEKDLRRERAA